MSQTPQSVTELFGQYLRRQMAAQAEGLGYADPDGQVVPHEAVPMQPIDPRLAWEDALAVFRPLMTVAESLRDSEPHSRSECSTTSGEPSLQAPPDWSSLVAAQEPAVAVAFCLGNFPQMVRDLQPLLTGGDLTLLRPSRGRPLSVSPNLLPWANAAGGYPQRLLAVAVLRLARRFEEASELLKSSLACASGWQALRENEEAALAWHCGKADEALAQWQTQKDSVPVLFNRGMAALFLGRPGDARIALEEAVVQLPDSSAWHHLGHLYLALAAARS